jgi:hypothetical protein
MQEVVFPKTNLAPTLPTVRIEQGLLELGFSARDIWSLFDHTAFPAIQFKSNKLCYFHEYARDILNDSISTKDFSTLVEMNERTVRCNLLQRTQAPRPLRRHNALDAQ